MKFLYQYHSSDNVQHDACIDASDRDAAFRLLKARGIRPCWLVEAPGFFNKLFGKGKRWIAIVVLGILCLVLGFVAYRYFANERRQAINALYDDRAQLYGDPVVIAECEATGWTNVFASAFDRYLAKYAIPGRKVEFAPQNFDGVELTPTAIAEGDLAEVAQMKRMVNGIKREAAEYIAAGGTIKGYLKRLDIRQRAENSFYMNALLQVRHCKDLNVWKNRNAELRAMGLPMVVMESVEE